MPILSPEVTTSEETSPLILSVVGVTVVGSALWARGVVASASAVSSDFIEKNNKK